MARKLYGGRVMATECALVYTELTAHVPTMPIDRPVARNALSGQMLAELGAALARLDEGPGLLGGCSAG